MNAKTRIQTLTRRDFLQTSAMATTAALFSSLGTARLFGASDTESEKNAIERVILNNGVSMPILGFGTLALNGEVGSQCVADAISLGYRLIDTAMIYGNEAAVGSGIKRSGINRDQLFITSKLWVDDSGYENTKKAFQTTLDKLQTQYLDLYLIHRPRGDVQGSWKAMEELHEEGKIRAIGISNFLPHQINEILDNHTIKPAVNQIETHAFFQQPGDFHYLKDHGIQMEAWAPFAEGRNGMFTHETLAAIAKKHGKTNAQVCLRWHYQRGIVAIPRSSQKQHMAENLNIFDFELDTSDLQAIASLDLNITQFPEWT